MDRPITTLFMLMSVIGKIALVRQTISDIDKELS